MRQAILGAAAMTILLGCGQAANPTATATPGPRTIAEVADALIARPLRLPAVPAGFRCPVTPVATASPGVRDPRGRGPFYLGGPLPQAGFPWNKTVYIVTGSPPPKGPILFRGGRIDGTGRVQFSGDPATASDPGVLLSSQGGVSAVFYDRAFEPAGGGALYVYPSTRGCYAIQVDGASFDDVIVVRAGWL